CAPERAAAPIRSHDVSVAQSTSDLHVPGDVQGLRFRLATVARPAVAILLPAAGGVIAAWATPRGPASAGHVVLWMAALLLLGATTGWVCARRWCLVAAPVAFFAAFELGRVGTSGPTVDAIHLDSLYGIIALV